MQWSAAEVLSVVTIVAQGTPMAARVLFTSVRAPAVLVSMPAGAGQVPASGSRRVPGFASSSEPEPPPSSAPDPPASPLPDPDAEPEEPLEPVEAPLPEEDPDDDPDDDPDPDPEALPLLPLPSSPGESLVELEELQAATRASVRNCARGATSVVRRIMEVRGG